MTTASTYTRFEIPKCLTCSAPIVWLRDARGRKVAVEPNERFHVGDLKLSDAHTRHTCRGRRG